MKDVFKGDMILKLKIDTSKAVNRGHFGIVSDKECNTVSSKDLKTIADLTDVYTEAIACILRGEKVYGLAKIAEVINSCQNKNK